MQGKYLPHIQATETENMECLQSDAVDDELDNFSKSYHTAPGMM